MINEMQSEILRLKKENDICILAHCYQRHEILEVADFVGDSYALAKKAANVSNKNIIMCGVRFMAETVKMLCPDKKVILSSADAGCPMAEQVSPERLKKLREENKGYKVVAYINTTAELKTLCDVCVTSSSAYKIIKAMPEQDILFIPDIHLGTYIKEMLPEKNIKLIDGGCPCHVQATIKDVKAAREKYPDAELLVHPECLKEVVDEAEYVGSTTGIMDYAKKSDKKDFIIGTENSIAEHLQHECPDKKFHLLSKKLICPDMKATTLADVLDCCKGNGGDEITMSEDKRIRAKRCIDEMIRYGG